ncbi:MAG TPA: FGGY-family carbohydrate kinase, partial [Candidatus Hydrogenedentes bacterium]|nr:FGGY-family carbohydrate kinase [Candidatus Hydrogenedentota bacterium]
TSCCDMMVAPLSRELPDIPGLCGIVPGSILPDGFGLEAGQSAVGDIFNWFVNYMRPENESHESLTEKALRLKPGESGLLALDWHNGNRTVLVDQRLTGTLTGMTLQTRPEEVYRALIEATAFGARVIMERFMEYGMTVERIVNCGGISGKNALLMQVYADVMGRPLEISKSAQTCALGAAMAGAVVAGKAAGGHDSFAKAAKAMVHADDKVYRPVEENRKIYDRLFRLYRKMHDSFGVRGYQEGLFEVMKELLAIRDEARA